MNAVFTIPAEEVGRNAAREIALGKAEIQILHKTSNKRLNLDNCWNDDLKNFNQTEEIYTPTLILSKQKLSVNDFELRFVKVFFEDRDIGLL